MGHLELKRVMGIWETQGARFGTGSGQVRPQHHRGDGGRVAIIGPASGWSLMLRCEQPEANHHEGGGSLPGHSLVMVALPGQRSGDMAACHKSAPLSL